MSSYYTDQGTQIKVELKKGFDLLEDELKSIILQIKDELSKTNDNDANSHILKCDEMSNNITDNFQIKIVNESNAVDKNAQKWQGWSNEISKLIVKKLNYTEEKTTKDGYAPNGDKLTYIETIEKWQTYSNLITNKSTGYIEFTINNYQRKIVKKISREKNENSKVIGENIGEGELISSSTATIIDEATYNKYHNASISNDALSTGGGASHSF